MTASAKTLALCVILAMAGAVVLLLRHANGREAPAGRSEAATEVEPGKPAGALHAVQPAPPAGPARQAVESAGGSGTSYGQGVTGVLVAPGGNPPPPTRVYLMETAGTDLFRQLMLAQRGVRIMPVAGAVTDRAGRFALGVEHADPSVRYEVRVASDSFVDHVIPNLTIQEDRWYDCGRVELARGAVVFGCVTIAGSGGLPVPGARVMVTPTNAFPSISPTPGREEGLSADVDAAGSYRLENVPPGVVNLAAVAPGYARVQKLDTSVRLDAQNRIAFELPPGVAIAGVVTDTDGKPVAGAKIDATAISSKRPATGTARSGAGGSFEIIGLLDGQYLLSAVAPGYVRQELKGVQAGEGTVQIVLDPQATARIRVFDKNDRVLSSYELTVKTHFPGQEQFGNTDIPPRRVRAGAGGIARIGGLDPGSYMFQVVAAHHCKAFSEPFAVAIGAPEPLVEVHLDEGGAIEGLVVDARSQPVAGARVRTLPNHLDDNPFTRIVRSMIPFKITQTSTTTDARGRYELSLLTPGRYQLELTHPESCDVHLRDIVMKVHETTTVETVQLEDGTVVSGVVRVDGKPAGQVKVTLGTAPAVEAPAPANVRCEAITDNEGVFVFGRRLPPGRYQIMAARQTLPNPLLQFADFQRTKCEITLGRGQAKCFVPINLSTR